MTKVLESTLPLGELRSVAITVVSVMFVSPAAGREAVIAETSSVKVVKVLLKGIKALPLSSSTAEEISKR